LQEKKGLVIQRVDIGSEAKVAFDVPSPDSKHRERSSWTGFEM